MAIKQYQAILDSYHNGQKRQMVEQIDEMTVGDFLFLLETDDLSDKLKLGILISYNRIKDRGWVVVMVRAGEAYVSLVPLWVCSYDYRK